MDSLTQIVLGAACGEAVLGRKIGNKALLFGAIGGTLPDLDVFIGKWLYGNEIDAMAFHRGFMHSFMFAFLAPLLIGWITYKLYNFGKRKHTTNLKDWIWLFFWSIFTHPVLDSFTPYGTQLFTPFSNYRVAFNNISVADPLYTLPFLICVMIVMFYKRTDAKRIWWNKAGIIISSTYLLFTIMNKLYVNSVFEKSFKKEAIKYNRFSVQPTILNNVLWYGIAETDNEFKVGFYSLLDENSYVKEMMSLPKNHHLIDVSNPDIKKLRWFSNEYYNLVKIDSTERIKYNDLRYPFLNPDDKESSIFSFELKKEKQRWTIIPFYGKPPAKKDLYTFWERIKGN